MVVTPVVAQKTVYFPAPSLPVAIKGFVAVKSDQLAFDAVQPSNLQTAVTPVDAVRATCSRVLNSHVVLVNRLARLFVRLGQYKSTPVPALIHQMDVIVVVAQKTVN